MLRSPLIRRVSIYLILSTAAVTGVNLLDLDQNATAPFYIPLFIGIYILSRWIDSRVGQNSSPVKTSEPNKTNQSTPNQKGFNS